MLSKSRLEAFSDGVIAIIITIMIFDIKMPELKAEITNEVIFSAFRNLIPKILAFSLSFLVLAIFWINHHALFDQIPHTTPKVIWANVFLLFVMSFIPLPTAFLAAHPFLPAASMFYGGLMCLNSFGFLVLRRTIEHSENLLPVNQNAQIQNGIAATFYLLSIPAAMLSVWISFCIFIGIPLWYFIPRHRKQTSH